MGGDEEILRKEIAEKASLVENEELYSLIETEAVENAIDDIQEGFMETATVEVSPQETNVPASASDPVEPQLSPLMKKIQRVTKPRAYPLFLAEVGALIAGDLAHDVQNFASSFGVEIGSSSSASSSKSSSSSSKSETKERVVVLGTGWGAAAFLKGIDTEKCDVTVISPRNFFLFTPMLAGASVGTVEFRSITEPIREINNKVDFLEATATEIDPNSSTVSCQSVVCAGSSCSIEEFSIEYDRLILTVGAQTNTFGIPGVRENCIFLKQVEDAVRIRTSIINSFERANLPRLTDEQREAILTFAVIGAGPTGVEFAAELRDFIEQDGPKYYPKLLKYVRIKLIEASSTILAPFDKSLQEAAMEQMKRKVAINDPEVANLFSEEFQLTELLLDSGVQEIRDDVISLNNGKEIPYGVAVWAAGNGPLPITLQLIESLGSKGGQADAQNMARGRIAIDPWLRVLGGDGKIIALGDCSCIVEGQLPATAQVAGQQGEFLARLMSKNYNLDSGMEEGIFLPPTRDESQKRTLAESISSFAIQSDEYAAPFQFLNLGILAYTGDGSALAQLQVTPSDGGRVKGKGKLGFGLWRSVYLSKQISPRNRLLVLFDWGKTKLFGRDITRL
eukprot:scaffold29516_cov52-Attheya_sp.AAC.2